MSVQIPTKFDCGHFLKAVRAEGIMMTAVDGQLRLWGPEDALKEPSLLATIREHKTTILDSLAENNSLCSVSKTIEPDPMVAMRQSGHRKKPIDMTCKPFVAFHALRV